MIPAVDVLKFPGGCFSVVSPFSIASYVGFFDSYSEKKRKRKGLRGNILFTFASIPTFEVESLGSRSNRTRCYAH